LSILDRYASAVRSSNLRSQPNTTFSDPDVIGAFGLAGKREPLGVALQRLFTGDSGAFNDVIEILAEKLTSHFAGQITTSRARFVAKKVIDWNRDKVCHVCNGLGRELIPGTPTIGTKDCGACRGTGQALFQKIFHRESLRFADWTQMQIEIVQSRAGQEAMKSLAPSLEL
jgi:hypothetical protein